MKGFRVLRTIYTLVATYLQYSFTFLLHIAMVIDFFQNSALDITDGPGSPLIPGINL
jgi:hypothetical protein